MTDQPLFDVQSLFHSYPAPGAAARRPVLHDICLSLPARGRVALIGRSGSGKSTLARFLLGLAPPEAGTVRYLGQPLAGLRGKPLRDFRRQVQIVFQDAASAISPRLRIGEVIAEPLRHLTGLAGPDMKMRIATLLEAVGLPANYAGKFPRQLSGGQLQRVALARALAPDPGMVVLDEAVSGLDLPLQLEIMALLNERHRSQGMGYLLITHDLRLARRFADRILVMDKGHIVEDQPVSTDMRFRHKVAIALEATQLPIRPFGSSARLNV